MVSLSFQPISSLDQSAPLPCLWWVCEPNLYLWSGKLVTKCKGCCGPPFSPVRIGFPDTLQSRAVPHTPFHGSVTEMQYVGVFHVMKYIFLVISRLNVFFTLVSHISGSTKILQHSPDTSVETTAYQPPSAQHTYYSYCAVDLPCVPLLYHFGSSCSSSDVVIS